MRRSPEKSVRNSAHAAAPDQAPEDQARALGNCCKNVYGRLVQTAAWVLAALQSMTFGEGFDRLSEAEQRTVRNLPARVYYGVNSARAIALRLLGVPREAAQPLASAFHDAQLTELRQRLTISGTAAWSSALGKRGPDYYRVWRILEGLD